MPGYPEHLRGFGYRGTYRYFLTCCTHERRPHFTRAETVDLVRRQILRAATTERIAIPVFCFMPDHVHLLAEGMDADASLKRFVSSAKQHSAYHFARAHGRRLWQRYSYERVLRSDEDSASVARYIIENPVRARLVTAPDEYPYWGSSVWTRGELLEFVQSQARRWHWAG